MSKSESERRRHKRKDVTCPVTVSHSEGNVKSPGKMLNVSDSGALLSIPIEFLPEVKELVHVTVSLPRSTPNTHMVEEIKSHATVVRHHDLDNGKNAGMAVKFEDNMNLDLDA